MDNLTADRRSRRGCPAARLRTLWLACLLVAAWAPALLGAERKIEVSLLLEETEIPVGVSTFAQVQVVGGYPDEVPGELTVPGLKIVKTSISYRNQFQDGKSVAATQILYSVTGEKAGDYVLPSFEVKLNGRPYGTNPVTIRILAPGKTNDGLQASRSIFLKFRAEKTEAYVNELVPIELLLYAKGTDSISKSSAPEFQEVEQFLVQRFPLSYTPQSIIIDGLPFTSMRFPTYVAGLSEGSHVLGPAKLEVGIRRGTSPSYPPGLPGDLESRTVVSNNLEFVIKPMPEAGRPPSFKGAVGRFELEVSATPTRIRLGDPLDVTIRIHGQGNFDNLSAPSLPSTPGWRTYPAVRLEGDRQTGLEQSVSFSQVAIPLQPAAELPSVEFSFFDPSKETYTVLHSPPVALQIEALASGGLAAAGGGLARWGISPSQLDDVLFIREQLSGLQPLTATTRLSKAFWLSQLLFLAALLALAAYGAREQFRKWREARAKTGQVSLAELRTAFAQGNLSWEDYYRLIFDYLNSARKSGEIWPRKLSGESRVILDQTVRAGETALYAGQGVSAGAVPRQERAQVLRALREWEQLKGKP